MDRMSSALDVEAKPDPIVVDPGSTAIIVVDMQNDFAAPGGMFDRAGIPIDAIQAIVEPIRVVLDAGRAAGMRAVFLKMQFAADLSDAGPPDVPNRIKHRPLGVGDRFDHGAFYGGNCFQSRGLLGSRWRAGRNGGTKRGRNSHQVAHQPPN